MFKILVKNAPRIAPLGAIAMCGVPRIAPWGNSGRKNKTTKIAAQSRVLC